MKVYTKVITDMTTGEVLEEEFYEYDGPVAECKGGDAEVEETKDEKVLAQVGKQQWERYKDTFAPLENVLMDRARMGEPEQAQATGVANAAVQQEYDGQTEQITQAMGERGVSAGSGATVSALGSSALDRAASQAMTQVNAQENVADAHYEGLESVIQLGRGKSADAVQGMSNIAARSNQEAVNSALNDFERRRSNVQGAASLAGAGTSALMSAPQPPGYNTPATRTSPSVVNDPGARDYHQGGGYRGSGF